MQTDEKIIMQWAHTFSIMFPIFHLFLFSSTFDFSWNLASVYRLWKTRWKYKRPKKSVYHFLPFLVFPIFHLFSFDFSCNLMSFTKAMKDSMHIQATENKVCVPFFNILSVFLIFHLFRFAFSWNLISLHRLWKTRYKYIWPKIKSVYLFSAPPEFPIFTFSRFWL